MDGNRVMEIKGFNKKGVTLIEVVVAFFILAILGLAVSRIHLTFDKYFESSTNKAVLQRKTGHIIEHISRKVRNCSQLNVQTSTEIELTKLDGSSITYKLEGESLVFVEGGKKVKIADGVKDIKFEKSKNKAQVLKINELRLEYKGEKFELPGAISVTLRNSM